MIRKQLPRFLFVVLAVFLFPTLCQASEQAAQESIKYQVSEQAPSVELAPKAINRIHCSEPIQNINAPQALQMEVEYQGNNAFVTLGEHSKRGVIYIITKGGDVFSMEIIPKRGLKARVLKLDSRKQKAIDNQLKFAGLDKETAAVDLIRNAFADTIPENFNVTVKDQQIDEIERLRIRFRRSVTIDGVPLQLNEYLVTMAPASKTEEITVDETSFLVPELTRNPTAICLGQDLAHFIDGKAVLRSGKYMRLFIVEQSSN